MGLSLVLGKDIQTFATLGRLVSTVVTMPMYYAEEDPSCHDFSCDPLLKLKGNMPVIVIILAGLMIVINVVAPRPSLLQ